MKNPFKEGDIKIYEKLVKPEDTAAFDSGMVHPVYATFALGRDAEWACRLFVLEMKEDDEEGIGTSLTIEHLSPALVGAGIKITASVKTLRSNEIICRYEVESEGRIIARGEQGQKILKKERLERIFEQARNKE